MAATVRLVMSVTKSMHANIRPPLTHRRFSSYFLVRKSGPPSVISNPVPGLSMEALRNPYSEQGEKSSEQIPSSKISPFGRNKTMKILVSGIILLIEVWACAGITISDRYPSG